MSVFGIDLGTTNSCISKIDEQGNPVIIQNDLGESTTPSVVIYKDPKNIIVGATAKESAPLYPDTVFQFVKILMGRKKIVKEIFGRGITPEEVSANILRKISQDTEEKEGESVKEAVITVPAYFGARERQATKNAAEIAGIKVKALINEPTAAAIYYGVAGDNKVKNILVFDLGGGTFDATVMKVGNNQIELICSDGIADLGGKNWDEALQKYILDMYKRETGFSGSPDGESMADLILQSENLKKKLSQASSASIRININNFKPANIQITRDKFNELTSHLLNKALDKTRKLIDDAKKYNCNNIDEILLVGGSTRMSQVTDTLKLYFNNVPIRVLDPDFAVAKGAALYANRENITQKAGGHITIPLIQDSGYIATKSYGDFFADPNTGELFLKNLILKNQKMENGYIQACASGCSSFDGQKEVGFWVVETDILDEDTIGDQETFKDNILADIKMPLPYNCKRGYELITYMRLDQDGTLILKGIDPNLNKEIEKKIQLKGVLTDAEIDTISRQVQGTTISRA